MYNEGQVYIYIYIDTFKKREFVLNNVKYIHERVVSFILKFRTQWKTENRGNYGRKKSYKFQKVLETYKTHKISLQVGRGETLLPENCL